MKFQQEVTAGRFIRKNVRETFDNFKKTLEFRYPQCSVLITEHKTFWESSLTIEGKDIPDEAYSQIKTWINNLKKLEQL